jgi:polyhydroxyalkanoate synthesis regulator phasin
MEKDVKRRVAAGAVALVAIAGGGAAIAATQISPKQESQAVLNDAAKELGVSPTELSAALNGALEKRIDAAVAAGRLTKTQGDELKQRIESGDFPLFGVPAFGPGHGGFEHHEMFGGLDAAATYLGVTEDELHSELESGNSLADVAKAKGKSVDGLVAALVAEAKKHLDEEVSGGDLTQEQADQILSRLEEGIRAMVNGEPPSAMPGPGFGFRHDFDRAPSFDGPPTFDGAAA